MFWQIASFPKCTHHVFLSHSQEDRAALVTPVYDALVKAEVKPWLDQKDYCYGRPSREALRDAVLDSRHVVFFVTDAMLNSTRGWCLLELAYAEILDTNLSDRGGSLATSILPLFLVDQDDARLPRSVWQLLRDRGKFFPAGCATSMADWCQHEIHEYLLHEQVKSKKVAQLLSRDFERKPDIKRKHGLFERVARFHPGPLS